MYLSSIRVIVGRNELDIAGFDRPLFPGVQYLLHPLPDEPVTAGDVAAVPSQDEVELGEFPLEIGPVMLNERGRLRREADAIRSNRAPEVIEAHFVEARRDRHRCNLSRLKTEYRAGDVNKS